MEATLCGLGIQNRHAMMVVPHRQSAQVPRPQSPSRSFDAIENSGGGGYFSYLRTVLSYANPLSYLRGNPTSNSELQGNEDQQHHSMLSNFYPIPNINLEYYCFVLFGQWD
jgi:UBX domain-containing protein 1/4